MAWHVLIVKSGSYSKVIPARLYITCGFKPENTYIKLDYISLTVSNLKILISARLYIAYG